MKYLVKKDCDWKSFAAREGAELKAADLKTDDGTPLPKEVVDHLLRVKAIVPADQAAEEAHPAPKKKADK